jgi:hypothetical protein
MSCVDRSRSESLLLNRLFFRHFRRTVKDDCQLCHVCLSVRPPTWNSSASTGRIFMKFDERFSKICRENSSFLNIWQYRVPYLKTFVHIWQYRAELFLQREMFRTKVIEKIETRILCLLFFPRKSSSLWDRVEKYGTVRLATGGSIICRMCFACWVPKATNTDSQNM